MIPKIINGTQLYRIEQLEKNYGELDRKLDRLLTNDVPHLHESMASLKTRINVLTAVNVGAVIMGVIISRLLI